MFTRAPAVDVVLVPAADQRLTPTLLQRLRASGPGGGVALVVCYDEGVRPEGEIAKAKRIAGLPPGVRDSVRHYHHVLADELACGDADIVEACVAFLEANTLRVGHGRARARIARQLKHVAMTSEQRERVVAVTLRRFREGAFGQQFRDHLRLIHRLDSARLLAAAREVSGDPRTYLRRMSEWVLRLRGGTPAS